MTPSEEAAPLTGFFEHGGVERCGVCWDEGLGWLPTKATRV
jgi:hypothetical protein